MTRGCQLVPPLNDRRRETPIRRWAGRCAAPPAARSRGKTRLRPLPARSRRSRLGGRWSGRPALNAARWRDLRRVLSPRDRAPSDGGLRGTPPASTIPSRGLLCRRLATEGRTLPPSHGMIPGGHRRRHRRRVFAAPIRSLRWVAEPEWTVRQRSQAIALAPSWRVGDPPSDSFVSELPDVYGAGAAAPLIAFSTVPEIALHDCTYGGRHPDRV